MLGIAVHAADIQDAGQPKSLHGRREVSSPFHTPACLVSAGTGRALLWSAASAWKAQGPAPSFPSG